MTTELGRNGTRTRSVPPPTTWWHLGLALAGMHPEQCSATEVRLWRRLDVEQRRVGVARDAGEPSNAETAVLEYAECRAQRFVERTLRPLGRCERRRLRAGHRRLDALAELDRREARARELGMDRYPALEQEAGQRRRAGDLRYRYLASRWMLTVLPLLGAGEVMLSASVFARIADIEVFELATLTVNSVIAWSVMLLVGLVAALAMTVAGRLLSAPRIADREGRPRPWLLHVAGPVVITLAVACFFAGSAYFRLSNLLGPATARRLGEQAVSTPWLYALILALYPIIVVIVLARGSSAELDGLHQMRRAWRRVQRNTRRHIRRAAAAGRREEEATRRAERIRARADGRAARLRRSVRGVIALARAYHDQSHPVAG